MIRPFKLPDNKIPIEVGDKSYIYKNVFNPIEWHYDEPYRVRVETLVLSKDGSSIFIRVRDDKTGYRLPGGSVDDDATFTEQAENETNEEALISVTKPVKTNICYTKPMDKDFIKKGGDSPLAYVGAITHVYVAQYTGQIDKSTIEEKDLDNDMAQNGKFYDINDIVDILDKWHIEALLYCKNMLKPERIMALQNRLDQLSCNYKPNYIFEAGNSIGGIKKLLYHGSTCKFDVFHPMSLDLGNAEQEPGWSTFCFDSYDYARRFAIMRAIQKILEEKNEKIYTCGWDMSHMKPYIHKNVESSVLAALCGMDIYVYTIDATNLKIGIGNDERFPEFTFREDNVTPDKVDKITLKRIPIAQDVTIIDVIPSEYDKYQYKHLSELNRGWFACMLNRDYSGDSAVAKLTKAVTDKILTPGMDVTQFMNEHGITLKDYCFYDRITESVFVRPVEFARRIYLGDQKMIYSSEPIDCPSSYTDKEEEEHASSVIRPTDKEFDDINYADVSMIYRGILYHINENGHTYKVGFCDIHMLDNESEKVLIGRIYVRPAFRHKGIGDVLYGYLRRFLIDSEFDVSQIRFYVSEKIFKVSSITGWIQSKRLTLELDDCASINVYKSTNTALAESVLIEGLLTVKSNRDLIINMDKWNPGTILWITGAPGDGKSTMAQKYATENNALLIHTDTFLARVTLAANADDFVKKISGQYAVERGMVPDPISLEYIKDHDNELPYKIKDNDVLRQYEVAFYKYLADTVKNDDRYNHQLVVVEGSDIVFMDVEFMSTQPCIILGASRITSAFRRLKRKIELGENVFVAVWKVMSKYNSIHKEFNDNKIRFRKDIERIISESMKVNTDDYPLGYGIITSGDLVDYAQYADLDSAMGPVGEGIVFGKDDIKVNMDKWEHKKNHNVLLVTGLSGSGKTTISYEIAYEKQAEVFQLDWISQPQYMKDSPETPNYGLWQYVKKNTDFSSVDTLSSNELHKLIVQVFETILEFANKNTDKLFIVEGIQIPTHLCDYPNIDDFPIIIKGTSMLTSMFRRFMRDKKNAWAFGIGTESILKWYLKREKDIKKFASQVTECNLVDISEMDITDAYVKNVHYVSEVVDWNKFLRPVYIILTYTATNFGKIITKFQHCKFSHAGIALSSKLDKVFTFNMRTETKEVEKHGKTVTKKEVKGGADIESLSTYVNPEDNGDADICVMCVFVNPDVHKFIEDNINRYFANVAKTKYDVINVFNIVINRAIDSTNSMKMICSQFVDNILKMAGIDITSKSSNLVSPNDFAIAAKENPSVFLLFDGKKSQYNPKSIDNKVRYIKNNPKYGELDISKKKDTNVPDHQYFYHLVPKGANISANGITTLEWQYYHDREMFRKNADKYRDRIAGSWGIFPGVDPASLSDDEIMEALKKFRGDVDGANRIYLFRYPPYMKLGPKMAAKLKQSDVYRIDVTDTETSKYIKQIDWGYDGSYTGNKKLDQSYYAEVSKKTYFCAYDETNNMIFAKLNHISIIPKDTSIPASCWTKIDTPVTIEDVPDNSMIMEASQGWKGKLPDSKFGLPDKRKYPLDTKEHVLSAIKFFNYAKKEDKEELAKNLNAGIEAFFDSGEYPNVGKNNAFYKYYNHKDEMYGEKVELAEAATYKGKPSLSSFKLVDNPDKKFVEDHINDASCIKEFLNDSVRKNSCMFLDTKTNEIACVFMVFKDRGHNILNNFEVTPKYRGLGLSKELLDYAVTVKGVDHLWVNDDNTIALNLYKKYGFKATGDKQKDGNHIRIYMELDKSALSEAFTCFIDDFKKKKELKLSSFTRIPISKKVLSDYDKESLLCKELKRIGDYDTGFVYTDKGNFVAVIAVDTHEKDGLNWITAVEVGEPYRGCGLSKQLLDVATKELGGNALSVHVSNTVALETYKKYGFKISKESENEVKTGYSYRYYMYYGNALAENVLTEVGLFGDISKAIKGSYRVGNTQVTYYDKYIDRKYSFSYVQDIESADGRKNSIVESNHLHYISMTEIILLSKKGIFVGKAVSPQDKQYYQSVGYKFPVYDTYKNEKYKYSTEPLDIKYVKDVFGASVVSVKANYDYYAYLDPSVKDIEWKNRSEMFIKGINPVGVCMTVTCMTCTSGMNLAYRRNLGKYCRDWVNTEFEWVPFSDVSKLNLKPWHKNAINDYIDLYKGELLSARIIDRTTFMEGLDMGIENDTLIENSSEGRGTPRSIKLYHGSIKQDLKYIEPRQESINTIVGNKNVVYASDDPRFCACFGVTWHDAIARQGTWDNWNTVTFGISDNVDLDKPCSLYELENDGSFTQIRTREFVSANTIKVKSEIKYNTGREMLQAYGVEVISLDEYKKRLNENAIPIYKTDTSMETEFVNDGDTNYITKGVNYMNKYNVLETVYVSVTPIKEWYYNDPDGINNCLIRIKEHNGALRGRGEILILSKDLKKYLICPVGPDSIYYQFGYRLPGGSFEESKTHTEQIITEAEEEIHIIVKDVWDSGERYAFTYDKPPKWVMEKIPKDHWWYGSYVEVFVGIYDGKYTGHVAETDTDQKMIDDAKWVTINSTNMSKLMDWHKRAIVNYLERTKGLIEAVELICELGIEDIAVNALMEADDEKKN